MHKEKKGCSPVLLLFIWTGCLLTGTATFPADAKHSKRTPLKQASSGIESSPVVSITSPVFGTKELTRLQEILGITIGHAIDPRRLDEGIRKLYEKKEVQTIFVEGTPENDGLHLSIRGEKIRILRHLRYTNVDSNILDEVKRKVEIAEDSPTNMRSFAALKEKLKEAYERRGFYFADVQIEFHEIPDSNDVDVEVSVQPNSPTIVSKIEVTGASREEGQTLISLVTYRTGERLSQVKIEDSTEIINRYFRRNQFPTSKVEDTILHFSPDKLSVTVQILVKMGKRFQFRFSGSRVFSDVELRELLTPEVISQSDATEKIVYALESKYHAIGYYFARVKPVSVVDEINHLHVIRFQIYEGPRVIIDKIDFTGGDDLGQDALESLFYESSSGVLHRHVFSEEGLSDTIKEMIRRLNVMGYLKPSITGPKTVFSDDRKGVQLYFDVDLGPRTRITQVEFEGNKELSQKQLEPLLPFKQGDPLDREKVQDARDAILNRYSAEGFIDAKIDEKSSEPVFSRDNKEAVIPFHITEGKRYRVGKITLEGNQKTKSEIILREVRVHENDNYDPGRIKRSEQDIALLGLFSRVEIQSQDDPSDPLKKDLKIIVRESDPGLGEVGVGAVYEDPRLRVRGFVSASYRNLMGLNQTAQWRNQVSLPLTGATGPLPFIEYSSVLGYRAPQPFHIPFDFSAQVGLDSFEISTVGPTLQTRVQVTGLLERKLSDPITFRYRLYRFERNKVDIRAHSDPAGYQPESITFSTIGSTGPGLVIDFRDDIFNPRHGSYHTLDLEFAHPMLLSQSNVGFLMALSRNSFYVPLISPFQFIFYVGLGMAHSLFNSPLPQVRLLSDLALGGQTSIRGFTMKRFHTSDSSENSGFYNFRGELNFPIVSDLSTALFMDSGQLFTFRSEDNYLRHDAIGIGLRYKTPVGPVVVDVAEGLGPDKEAVKFYFTVGTL